MLQDKTLKHMVLSYHIYNISRFNTITNLGTLHQRKNIKLFILAISNIILEYWEDFIYITWDDEYCMDWDTENTELTQLYMVRHEQGTENTYLTQLYMVWYRLRHRWCIPNTILHGLT